PNSTPQRRQDFDVVLLAASPLKAQEITALLKYNYAGNVPIYALSSAYDSSKNTDQNKELDGIYLHLMPWMVNTFSNHRLQTIKEHINQLWPTDAARYPQ